MGGSNFIRLEKYANINNFLLFRSQHKQQKQKCFSVPHDICTPKELLSFAVEIPMLLANVLSHIGVDLKKTTLSETITGQLSNILAKNEHELQEAGCHFLSHENLLKLWGNGFQFHFLRCITGGGVFHIALQMGLLFHYTNLKLLKKMCHKDPLWCNDSQNMQRFEKSIRSIVKNIGSERAELCWQYLAYFVCLLGLFLFWSLDIPNMDIYTVHQHLKNRRGSHCWSIPMPIGHRRPEIRRIAVWHSNSPVVKVDPP